MPRFLTFSIAIVLGSIAISSASASEPDISLTCTDEKGRDWDVKVFMSDRRIDIDGIRHSIAEVRSDRIVSEQFPNTSDSDILQNSWTIFRSTLKFRRETEAPKFDRFFYSEGDCRKTAAQF